MKRSYASALAAAVLVAGCATVDPTPPQGYAAPRTDAAKISDDRYFNANGMRLRYIERGVGEPVLLLHGRGGNISTWLTSGVVENLAKDYRVIALDFRGHGKSDKPHDPKQYGSQMALDVVRMLDHLRMVKS